MDANKKRKLEAAGWKVGDAKDFLGNEKMVALNPILQELDKSDPEIDKAWAKETVRRQKEMRSGEVKALSMNKVFGKYKK